MCRVRQLLKVAVVAPGGRSARAHPVTGWSAPARVLIRDPKLDLFR